MELTIQDQEDIKRLKALTKDELIECVLLARKHLFNTNDLYSNYKTHLRELKHLVLKNANWDAVQNLLSIIN